MADATNSPLEVSAPSRRCIVPQENGFVDDGEPATVLGEARKNADRDRLLWRTYPFEYRMAKPETLPGAPPVPPP